MDVILVLLGLGCLIAIVIGLIKPSQVIRWGEKKTRSRVLMIYGGLFIVLFIALGMTGTSNGEKNTSKTIMKSEESKEKPVEEAKNKDVDLKYDQATAKKRIIDWLGEHEFPNVTKLSLNPGNADGKLFETDGKKYHMFELTGLPRAVDLLVDPYTGEVFFYDTGVKPQPIDKWYVNYRASHKTDSSSVINDDFAWVEEPSMQDGYIVGKVKNTSNKTFKSATIVFDLYDGSKNRIGSVGADIRNLKTGDIWSFQVSPYLYEATASYELESIEGYTW